MDGVSGSWEIVSDIYRDVILTGMLFTIIGAVYRLGGWREEIRLGIRNLSEKMTVHIRENKESHDKIHTIVEVIDEKVDSHGEDIAALKAKVG
jgi:hypothetical protein